MAVFGVIRLLLPSDTGCDHTIVPPGSQTSRQGLKLQTRVFFVFCFVGFTRCQLSPWDFCISKSGIPLFPGTFQYALMTYIGLSSQVHVCFSHHTALDSLGHRWYLVCLKVLSNAALLSQSSKVMESSEEPTEGKADGESLFFLLHAPKAGLWHPGHPFSIKVPRESAPTSGQ